MHNIQLTDEELEVVLTALYDYDEQLRVSGLPNSWTAKNREELHALVLRLQADVEVARV